MPDGFVERVMNAIRRLSPAAARGFMLACDLIESEIGTGAQASVQDPRVSAALTALRAACATRDAQGRKRRR